MTDRSKDKNSYIMDTLRESLAVNLEFLWTDISNEKVALLLKALFYNNIDPM